MPSPRKPSMIHPAPSSPERLRAVLSGTEPPTPNDLVYLYLVRAMDQDKDGLYLCDGFTAMRGPELDKPLCSFAVRFEFPSEAATGHYQIVARLRSLDGAPYPWKFTGASGETMEAVLALALNLLRQGVILRLPVDGDPMRLDEATRATAGLRPVGGGRWEG